MWVSGLWETAAGRRAYIAAACAVLAAFGARLLLAPVLGSTQPYSLFYPVILAAGYLLGRGPAIAAAVLSGGLAFGVIVGPPLGFRYSVAAWTALCFFAGTSAVAVYLLTGLRSALRQLAAEQGRLQVIADTHTSLFKDLQARIGHHMNLLVGILSFQAKGEPDPEMLALLRKAGERSQLIAQTLNEISGAGPAPVEFGGFARSLARRVCQEADAPAEAIEVVGDPVVVPVEVATSLGVALAECLAWIMQRQAAGVVTVRLTADPAVVRLRVSHSGEVGSERVALAPSAFMFRAMVEQLGAAVSFEADAPEGPGLGISLPLAAAAPAEDGAWPHTLH